MVTQPSESNEVIVEVSALSKKFGAVKALDQISFELVENRIYGLLGRNGAGKTTLMQLLTGQDFPTKGTIRVFGQNPVEHPKVLQELCFIKESQKYPENFKAKHVLKSAAWFYKNWDQEFAEQLVKDFNLPTNRMIKKMSRGQQSALGVILGLASRAKITFFDEPYLGLDAAARQIFYDHLLSDFSENPRTVILSTHLIDEVSNLLEHVIVLDQGQIIINDETDNVRGSATSLAGKASEVEQFVQGFEILNTQRLGGLVSVTLKKRLSSEEKRAAEAKGIEVSKVSLQQLVISVAQDNSDKESA